MSIIEMAKAHLQNVHSRIEQLKNQKQAIEDEINKLSLYVSNGLNDIDEAETQDKSIEISTK
jgi:hypothetical protein